MSYLLGIPDNLPAVGDPDAPCCMGVAERGPESCTCWSPVFDLEQTDPDGLAIAGAMARPCSDCAYRKNSPERRGEEHMRGDEEFLERIVVDGEPFWCHDGMRQVVAWKHEGTGIRLDLTSTGDYRPPVLEGIPYRADGRPGDLCAGWLARRLKHMQQGIHARAAGGTP